MKSLTTAIITACLLCLAPFSVMAQKLNAFEKSVNKPSPQKKTEPQEKTQHCHHTDSCIDDVFSEIILDIITTTIMMGRPSMLRVQAETNACAEAGLTPRELGERQIPFARADFSYQDLGSGIDSYDYRAELGYGPFGLEFKQTHYREETPRDRLDLTRVHALYRMSFGDYVELDTGFGTLWIDGDEENSRFSFTMPIFIYPNEVVGIEFRPAWASNVSEYDLAVLVSGAFSSFKTGYRWVNSPDENLHGPYAGVALHF